MCKSITNNAGLSLIEVLISLFLISFGVLGLISVQPPAWNLSAKSDFLGRAGGILHKELQRSEALIINPCNPNPCSGSTPLVSTVNVLTSGLGAAQAGDQTYTVRTSLTENGDNTWTAVVTVTWPGNLTGISESLIITRQENFRFPLGCV
jgi:Tfp pilus assembly protein PilV